MVRDTSVLTYHQVLEEGFLAEREIEVYKTIKILGEPTDREIAAHLNYADPNMVRPSRKHLVDRGLLIEVAQRTCAVSGRTALTWKVPDLAHYRAPQAMTKCPHCAGKGKVPTGPVQATLQQKVRTIGTGYCACGQSIMATESACKFCRALESLKEKGALQIKHPDPTGKIEGIVARSV